MYQAKFPVCVFHWHLLLPLINLSVSHIYCSLEIHTLATFIPPQLPQFNTSGLQRVLDLQTEYNQEKNPSIKYSVLSNLNYYLKEIFSIKNCIILIDNFRSVNIPKWHVPIILRTPVPIIIVTHSKETTNYMVSNGINTVPFKKVSLADVYSKNLFCSSRNLFVKFEGHLEVCLRINLTEFARKARSINCQVHLGIFPPSYVVSSDIMKYPTAFHSKIESRHYRFSGPLSNPNINGIIGYNLSTPVAIEQLHETWIEATIEKSVSRYAFEIFVILETSPPTDFNSALLAFTTRIEQIYVLQICYICRHGKSSHLGTFSLVKANSFDIEVLTNLAFSGANLGLTGKISSVFNQKESLLSRTMKLLQTNVREKPPTNVWLRMPEDKQFLDKVAIAHSHVFDSILGNFSATPFNTPRFQIVLHHITFKKSEFIFTNYPVETLTNPQFVGCGMRRLTSVPFQELVRIFDKILWISIIFTIAFVSGLIKLLLGKSSFLGNIISVLKSLLEQGNPIPPSVVNAEYLRCLIGLFLLMAIILSNAYKNTNVYRMVMPRTPIQYKYFSEVLQDKFNIYTRSISMYPNFKDISNKEPQEEGYESLTLHSIGLPVYILTEVGGFIANQFTKSNGNETILAKEFAAGTIKMHPEVITTFENVKFPNLSYQPNITLWQSAEIVEKVYPMLQNIEAEILLESAGKCQKTVVVLPSHMCKEFQTSLIKKDPRSSIFVGEELSAEMNAMFSFEGLVPPLLISRVYRIAESGIWEWWVHVAGNMENFQATTESVMAVSMSGNVVVVFCVWLCGIILAILFHIPEHINIMDA